MLALFEMFDADKSGQIDEVEFWDVCDYMGIKATAEKGRQAYQCDGRGNAYEGEFAKESEVRSRFDNYCRTV